MEDGKRQHRGTITRRGVKAADTGTIHDGLMNTVNYQKDGY
jgi:hypothetical protein